jgi:hypothetical protein
MNENKEVAIIDNAGKELVAKSQPYELSVTEVEAQVKKIQDLMKNVMIEGTHYGPSFPGDEKKNLLKPGADKLCFIFRLRQRYTQETIDLGNGHIEVITKCELIHIESGTVVGEGMGSCSTMESKYRWRNASRKCPVCGNETIIQGKKEYGGGWLCYAKKGGCGAKFDDNDPAIIDQKVGKIENSDIADVHNTVRKISAKRAYVGITITSTAASDIFSQDAEDFEQPEHITPAQTQPVGATSKKTTKTTTPPVTAEVNYEAIITAAEAAHKLSAADAARWRKTLEAPDERTRKPAEKHLLETYGSLVTADTNVIDAEVVPEVSAMVDEALDTLVDEVYEVQTEGLF